MSELRSGGAGTGRGRVVEQPAGSVVRVLQANGPGDAGRERLVVLPAPPREVRPRRRRHTRAAIALVVAGALVAATAAALSRRTARPADWSAESGGDVVTQEAAAPPATAAAAAASHLAAWAADSDVVTPRGVARGIVLLADALRAAGDRSPTAARALATHVEVIAWHAEELARGGDGYALYAVTGHVHGAFARAARSVALVPGIDIAAEAPLRRAADAVGAQPLREQEGVVRSFLGAAAATLSGAGAAGR